MRSIVTSIGETAIALATAQTALAFPPLGGNFANVEHWNGDMSVPEFDLEVWAAASVNLTSAEIYGGVLHAHVIADDTFTAANASELFTAVAHGLQTGDGPIQLTTTTTLPAGLSLATDYYVIRVDADTFRLATSFANALAGSYVSITTDGTGTHTLSDTATTMRMKLHSIGLLGHAADGAVGLTDSKSYVIRCKHRPRCVAYAISATLSGAVAVSASVSPVVEG